MGDHYTRGRKERWFISRAVPSAVKYDRRAFHNRDAQETRVIFVSIPVDIGCFPNTKK
jgi:hypothetical protein